MADPVSRAARLRGHQVDTIASRRLVLLAGGLIALLFVIAAAGYGALKFLGSGRETVGSVAPVIDAVPRLQSAPASDLKALRREKAAMLEGYRWVDSDKGIVQIPIERAMAVIAGQGVAPTTKARPVPPVSRLDPAKEAGFDQHLGTHIPLGLRFRDEAAREVTLGDYFGGVPTVMLFTYFGCSSLCPTAVSDLAGKLGQSGLAATRQYQVVVASIDPRDTPADAAAKKSAYLGAFPHAGEAAGWHLLTGSDAAVASLTGAAGFRYAYDNETSQFAHPAGFAVITPAGTISRYFFGFDYTPSDLRDSLQSASREGVASAVERLLLLCFHLEPGGRHSATVLTALRWIGVATVMLLLAGLIGMRRR